MTNNIEAAIKNFDIRHNVSFRVIDQITGQIVQEVQGHNAATNSMLQGIAHYLVGDGVVNQAAYTLARFIPRYISLGTMGLFNQDCDEDGLPLGIGGQINVDHAPVETAENAMNTAKNALDDAARCTKGEILPSGAIACRCYNPIKTYNEVDRSGSAPLHWDSEYDSKYYVYDEGTEQYIFNTESDWGKASKNPLYTLTITVTFECDICNDPERQAKIAAAIEAYEAAVTRYETELKKYNDEVAKQQAELFTAYMNEAPGFGADGYDKQSNNGRKDFGLGPKYSGKPIGCELINDKFPRVPISFRQIIPEAQAELPETIDIVFSAMISTGALAQFRDKNPKTNKDRGYIFITEAGLWSKKEFVTGGDNGLLAGYRLGPPNETQWDMYVPANRKALQRSILRVGYNQVVQVIWKVQLGALGQFIDIDPVKRLYLTNIVIQPSGWTSYTSPDAELADYHWMYSINFEGVNADMLPTVIFNPAQVRDDNYADVCDSGDKCVIIYAKTKPETAFTIPTIYAEGTR